MIKTLLSGRIIWQLFPQKVKSNHRRFRFPIPDKSDPSLETVKPDMTDTSENSGLHISENNIDSVVDSWKEDSEECLTDKNLENGSLEKLQNLPDSNFALSFSGCGFLGCYHFGVVSCFNKNGKKLISKVDRVAGASMGSMVAALMVFAPDTTDNQCTLLYDLAEKLNNMRFGALSPGFSMNDTLRDLIDSVIPQDISPAQNRLHISLTHQTMKTNRLISVYPDRDYLINCLLASCYIPVWSGSTPPELDGEIYIDGGYTENLPTFKDTYTLTISPFSGDAIICPHDRNFFEWRMKLGNQTMKVNMHNIVRGAQALFPPTRPTLRAYYEMGFRDAMRYLLNHGCLERVAGTEV